ncbi:PqqD family protein [Thioclava sp.]|uniref:PqqD family protein n=1 Tax=Thioclava sp. TaxID=1933450 RepID=UPI003AA9AF6B
MTTCYQLAGPDIVHESFGGDLVVLNLRSGQYFGLNPSAALLWSAIVDGQSITDDLAAGAAAFAQHLIELGLIVPATTATAKPAVPLSLDSAPTIEVYDDLSDLIVADPIHDVDDEAGWPKMQKASS